MRVGGGAFHFPGRKSQHAQRAVPVGVISTHAMIKVIMWQAIELHVLLFPAEFT